MSRRLLTAAGCLVLIALPACAGAQPGSLPEEYLGRWYYTGSSGGITGDGAGDEPTGFIVIRSGGSIDHYTEDGTDVGTSTFTVSRGPTIFSTEDQWILTRGHDAPEVIRISDDGLTLSFSENVYDGFSRNYARSR